MSISRPSKFRLFGQSRARRGFTILEILTAMVILAIVVSLVFASFNSVFSSADQVNASSDLYEMGNNCLMRISSDLQNIHIALYPRYKPPGFNDPPEIYRFVGHQDTIGGESFARLRFTTLAHLPTHQSMAEGIAEVVYYAQETETGGVVIKRADTLFPYPEFEPRITDPIMCEKVRSFELLYFDHEGQEYHEWDSQSEDFAYSTPYSVAVRLVIGDEQTQHEFSTEILFPLDRYQPVKR
jgi:general secretion pathway protein J